MPVAETVITSLGELLDRVTPSAPDPALGRRRDLGVYHGAVDATRPLLTTLDRLGGISPPHTKLELEEHILRNFIRYSRPYLGGSSSGNDWELLVAAQHHGVPTRLLDWTYSPLIAAFFATRAGHRHILERDDRSDGNDRAIWRLDWQIVHEAFGLPRLALLIEDLETVMGAGNPCTPWRLFARTSRDAEFACLLEPPSLDARIVAQAAVFTLCSSKCESFDAFLDRHDLTRALTKLVIPAQHVAQVRDQLDLVSVDERRLFPDLDGVAAALRRYYA